MSVLKTTQLIEAALLKDKPAEALALAKTLPQVVFNDDISFDDIPPSNALGIYKKKAKSESNIE